jgi:hypothetical protein
MVLKINTICKISCNPGLKTCLMSPELFTGFDADRAGAGDRWQRG